MVEQELQFRNGKFTLISFLNKLTKNQYISKPGGSEQFRVSVNGTVYTGATGGWAWRGGAACVLAQGEIQLVVKLENDLLRVEKT
jgi:hypothetical protein